VPKPECPGNDLQIQYAFENFIVGKLISLCINRPVVMSLLVGFMTSGCSEIIPGLNIHMNGRGEHEYKIVAKDGSNDYQVEPASPAGLKYEIVPLDSAVISSNALTPAPDASEQLPSILPSDVTPEYRIGPGDIVYITIWEHPELTQPFSGSVTDPSVPALQGRIVAADGTMFYPYVGTIKAEGMTSAELRDYITKHIGSVVVQPQIDARVVAFRANRIEVAGEVNKPGTITLDDMPKGVLQALDLCGGLTLTASRRHIILLRKGQTYSIDLAGLLSGSRVVPNPALEPGDVLHVPDQSGDQVFMLGAVTSQKPLIIQQDSKTLIQALTEAGGLNVLSGNQSGVYIFRAHRVDGELQATVFTVSLANPSGVLLASQFQLQPADIVYVKATAFAQYNSVVNEILPTVQSVFYTFETKSLAK